MKRLNFLIAACLLFPSSPIPVLALGTRTVFATDVEKSVISLKVHPGYGLNINFISTGEVVKRAWLDDPSRIVLSFDGCLSEHQSRSCSNGSEGATVVHLRHIKTIHFENLPRSPNGGTLLTLITEGARGRKLYQFRVIPAEGTPDYTTLTLKPDLDRPESLFVTNLRNNFPAPVPSPLPPTPTRTGKEEWRQEPEGSSFTTATAPPPEETIPNPDSPSQQPEPSTTATWKRDSQTEQSSATSNSSENQVASLEEDNAVETAVVETPETASPPDESKESSFTLTAEATEVPKSISSPVSASVAPVPSPQTNPDLSIRYANNIAYGLVIASKKKQINYGTQMYRKVQSAIRLLRRGKSKEEGAHRSKVPMLVIEQLTKWGQSRP